MNVSNAGNPPLLVSTTRGYKSAEHYVLTPANQFGSRLPGLAKTVVKKLATPRNGPARFGMYLLEIEPGGGSSIPLGEGFENFLFALDDGIAGPFLRSNDGVAGAFAFYPIGERFEVTNSSDQMARVIWIKRRYEFVASISPSEMISGQSRSMEAVPGSVPGIFRLELLPVDDPAFDFSMSVLSFDPGAVFPKLEIHDEEHGLYMLDGQGVYYLDGQFHEVQEDDFIYMAPYCPQYYYPTGHVRSAYLLYKDVFRDGF